MMPSDGTHLHRVFEEIVKQGAVIDDRLPQLLGSRFTTLPPARKRACDTVVLDDAWMLDGQVGSSCVEILRRISTCCHHFGDESIRSRDRAVRIVDEHALDPVPFTREGVHLLL